MDLRASVLVIGTILGVFTPWASACSIAGTLPPPYTIEEVFYAAPIVIYGKDIGHTEMPENGEDFGWVFFEVYCIFKDSSGLIKENANNLTLDAEYLYHSCMHTNTEAGQEYLMALTESDGKFSPWEPGIMNTANFPPTPNNLAAAFGLCGLQNVTETGVKMDACPKKSGDVQEGCKEAVYTGKAAGHVGATLSLMTLTVVIATTLQGSY